MTTLDDALMAMKLRDDELVPHMASGADRVYMFKCPECLTTRRLYAAVAALLAVRNGDASAAGKFLDAEGAQEYEMLRLGLF
jgi:hypothetical protein